MSDRQLLPFDVRDIQDLCARHKKMLVRTPLILLALGAVVFWLAPRTYRSEARIFLRLGRESVGLDPTASTGQTLALQQADRKDEVKSAIEILKSRAIVGQAVDKVTPDVVLGRHKGVRFTDIVLAPLRLVTGLVKSIDPISDREAAILRVEKKLYVNAERESTVIAIQYDAKSPQLAQEVCDAVVDSYRQAHMRIHRSEESRSFFVEQQERLRNELDGALNRVREVKNTLGISSVAERRTSLEAQYNAVELDRLTTEQALATATARSADIEKQLSKTPERLVDSKKQIPNQGADLLHQQFYALQVKVMELEAKYKETHPLLVAAKEQLAEAKRVMGQQADERTETTDNINTIYRDLSLELKREQGVVAGLKARAIELAQQKESVVTALRSINDQDLKIDQLSRAADLARDRYMQYSRNMEEARIDKALESGKISNVSIVQPATLAEQPVSPSTPLVFAATILLTVAGTVGLVLGTDQWERHKKNSNDFSDGSANGSVAKRRVVSRRRIGRPQVAKIVTQIAPQTQPPI